MYTNQISQLSHLLTSCLTDIHKEQYRMQLLNINKKIMNGWAFQLEFITWRGTKNDFPIYENSFSVQFEESMGINWLRFDCSILDIWIYSTTEKSVTTEG